MPIKINCTDNVEGAWCKNKNTPRSLFGLGARCCVEYPEQVSCCCAFKTERQRPTMNPHKLKLNGDSSAKQSSLCDKDIQSPRITEQDARYKKLLSLAKYYLHCAEHEDRVPYAFFHSEFSALLNKLNGDHNGK